MKGKYRIVQRADTTNSKIIFILFFKDLLLVKCFLLNLSTHALPFCAGDNTGFKSCVRT